MMSKTGKGDGRGRGGGRSPRRRRDGEPEELPQLKATGRATKKQVFDAVFEQTLRSGMCVLEIFQCDRCGCGQMVPHYFLEVLRCGNCGQEQPSRSPRPVQRGEITGDHLGAQIYCALENWSEKKWGKDTLDMEKLKPADRAVIMSKCAEQVRETLGGILRNAGVMARGAGIDE